MLYLICFFLIVIYKASPVLRWDGGQRKLLPRNYRLKKMLKIYNKCYFQKGRCYMQVHTVPANKEYAAGTVPANKKVQGVS